MKNSKNIDGYSGKPSMIILNDCRLKIKDLKRKFYGKGLINIIDKDGYVVGHIIKFNRNKGD